MRCTWCQKRVWFWQAGPFAIGESLTLHVACQANRLRFPHLAKRLDERRALETLYKLQHAVEEKLYQGEPQGADYVALVEERSRLDEMILVAGGKSGIVLDY